MMTIAFVSISFVNRFSFSIFFCDSSLLSIPKVTGMHNLQQMYFDSENGDEYDEFNNQQNVIARFRDLKVSDRSGK